jgi:hypothetical protein
MTRLTWIVVTLLPIQLIGQISLRPRVDTVLYRGIENVILVTKESEAWKDIGIKADHGKLRQSKRGEYAYTTDSLARSLLPS